MCVAFVTAIINFIFGLFVIDYHVKCGNKKEAKYQGIRLLL